MNYYEILEVSPNASQEVLKAAYKSLMQRYHPDRNLGNAAAAEHSVLVVQAYEVLSDSSKRAAYDIELKGRLENLNSIQDRVRNSLASASLDDTERESHWLLWLLIALIILLFWFVWSSFEKKQSSGSESKEVGSLLGGFQSENHQDKAGDRATALAARTIPVFINDLTVNLEASAESTNAPAAGATRILSIQTLGVVAGSFDPDRFISFMENNKEFISRKLAEKLVSAQYEMLIKHNGDQYLKRVILDAIGEITGANRFEEYPPTGTESPSHYGAVDVLLPDSYTVTSQ